MSRLIGSGLGGVVAAIGGITAVAAADAATFLVAALLVVRIGASGPVQHPGDPDVPEVTPGRVATLVDEWRVGLRATWHSPMIRMLVIFTLITSTGEGIMGTLFAPYVREVLHSGAQIYGLISGVQAIGGIIGGFFVASLATRWSPVVMLGAGAVAFGLVDLAIFLYPLAWVSPWPAVAGMIVVGLPGAVTVAGLRTLFQRNTVDAERGRVFALGSLAGSVSLVIGSLGAGLLGGPVGIMPVLAMQGVGYVVAGLLILVQLPRLGRHAPVAQPVEAPGLGPGQCEFESRRAYDGPA
jgi:MFS family permease